MHKDLVVLRDAISLAFEAHTGQKDKAGQPYILHPLAVMAAVDDVRAKIVAVLHDVIEDSYFTADDLRDIHLDEELVDAVLSVTRLPGETYSAFIRRARKNPIGRVVKIADVKHNMSRIHNLPESERGIVKRYEEALVVLAAPASP